MPNTPVLTPLLLDTNVLIYHLKGVLAADITALLADTLANKLAHISVITRIEMLAWNGHSADSLLKTTALLSELPEVPLTEAVVSETIRVRKAFGLKLPDAVIAATASVHGWQLLTGNGADFKRVAGLDLRCI
jgi:predicted nucleic acid-binding protein